VVTLSSRKTTTCTPFYQRRVLFSTIDLADKVVKTRKLDTRTAIIVAKTRRGALLIFNKVFLKT
jgi:hypothetical protein